MRFLLDTHTLIWFITDDSQLNPHALQLIKDENNELFVSVASLWEMAIKFSTGKLNIGQPFEALFPLQLQYNDIKLLPISIEHLHVVSELPFHHRDPFDRLIIAQSQVEKMPIIGIDEVFDLYDVQRVWG